jgi:hypothetical protein
MLGNFTDITILLDASSSMWGKRINTRKALLDFILEQKTLPDAARLTLVEFHQRGHVNYRLRNTPLAAVPDDISYNPDGGSTALRDAWLQVIADRGNEFAARPESDRPSKVLFMVLTDGEDNASLAPDAAVKSAVKHQESVYNWNFVYVGANHDAEVVGYNYGLDVGKTMSFDMNNVAYTASVLSGKTSTLRSSGIYANFTKEERERSIKKDDDAKV